MNFIFNLHTLIDLLADFHEDYSLLILINSNANQNDQDSDFLENQICDIRKEEIISLMLKSKIK
jgi:hypothetical protein